MTAAICSDAASAIVPGAPRAITAGPATAAPSANAPTFMLAAVVKI